MPDYMSKTYLCVGHGLEPARSHPYRTALNKDSPFDPIARTLCLSIRYRAMSVLIRELGSGGATNDPWRLVYDIEARHLFVESRSDKKRFSIDAFMAQDRGLEAQEALLWLLLDMFPNTPEDA